MQTDLHNFNYKFCYMLLTKRLQACLLIFLLLAGSISFGQNKKSNEYWLSFTDTSKDKCGYKNQSGDTVIQPGQYTSCFTDTFRTYAIVAKPNAGFIAIDRKQNILYSVFPFDNGPDYVSGGFFRIIKNGKIGYADAITGKVIIQPQFKCAFPFENGIAKVSFNCTKRPQEEHIVWTSNDWLYIDKTGRKVSK